MKPVEDLPIYPTIPPRGAIRKAALWGINRLLGFRGLKLPPDFPLNARFTVLRKETEPDIRHLCRQIIQPGMTVVDIGANVGLLTRHFCRLAGPAGKVFAIEPDPRTFRYLEFNTEHFSNLELLQAAVSDNENPAYLHLNPISRLGNSLYQQSDNMQSVKVACVSVDEFLKQRKDPKVDVMKIDVEGAELHVLRGMRKTFARLPKLKIIMEYCPANLKSSGVEPENVLSELRSQRMTFRIIREDGSLAEASADNIPATEYNVHGYVNLFCSRKTGDE